MYVLEQSIDAEVDWGMFQSWGWFQFSLQQTDIDPYKESIRLNKNKQDYEHTTVFVEVDPVEFTELPPNKIFVEQGSDLELEWEWTYRNDTKATALSPALDDVLWVYQMKFKPDGNTFSKEDMTYWYCSPVKSEENLCPEDLKVAKGKVVYTEKAGDDGKINATATLIMKNIQLEDQTMLYFVFEKSVVSYSMITQLIVAPNTALFPPRWHGASMHQPMARMTRKFVFKEGSYALLACEGAGNSISDVFLGTGRQTRLNTTDGHFLYFPVKFEDYQILLYAIADVKPEDAGNYYCNVDGFGKRVTFPKKVVVKP